MARKVIKVSQAMQSPVSVLHVEASKSPVSVLNVEAMFDECLRVCQCSHQVLC